MMILSYILNSILQAGMFLGIVLLPCVVLLALSQFCSGFLRTRMAHAISTKAFVYGTAIGVVLHECGHALFCIIFRHKIQKIIFFSPSGDGTLGSVSYTYNKKSIYQKIGLFFVGTGPVWFGLLALFLISWLLLPSNVTHSSQTGLARVREFAGYFFSLSVWCKWQTWLWLYLSLSVAAHITLSRPDIEGAWTGFVTLILTVLVAFLILGLFDGFFARANHAARFFAANMMPVFVELVAVSIIALIIGAIFSLFPRRR